MAFWATRLREIESIDETRRRMNDYYREIETCENRLQAAPFAVAAKNSYNHVIDTLLSTHLEIPLDRQDNLTISFNEGGIPVETRFGFSIRICGQDESRFITDGFISRETSETLLMLMLAEHVDCFFDVGANVGYFSLLMCTAGQSGLHSYAFEPRLPVFQRLVASIEDNGFSDHITANNCAVGETDTQAVMTLNKQGSGGNTLCRQHSNPDHDNRLTETVEVTSLDGFLKDNRIHPHCAVLKIDVEGYETRVIDGAMEFLSGERAPIVLIETFPRRVFKQSHDHNVMKRLRRLGYHIYAIEPFRNGFSSLRPGYRFGIFQRCRAGNYLAFPANQTKLEALCCQPMHEWALLSTDRLKRIINFQKSAIREAEEYFRQLSNSQKNDTCAFRTCLEDFGEHR